MYQRKSGDPWTIGGNTTFLMAVLAVFLPIEKCHMTVVAGDDSVVFSRDVLPDVTTHITDVFNLEAKMFSYKYPYFCSKFLLRVEGRYYFVPDPLKIVTKLGRHDLVNFEHAEDYRVSLLDLVKCYRDVRVMTELNEAMCERYPYLKGDWMVAFTAILELASNPNAFKKLFFCPEGGILCKDPKRPTLK